MNKRIIAALLALVMMLAMAACGAKAPVETQAPETQAPETQAPTTEAAPAELGKIAILNTAQAELAFTKDAEARFNSVWMPAYSVADYVAANFWFAPTEETAVGATSWQDGYTWEQTYATFANQFLSIAIDASMAENHEVVVCGEGSGDDVHPWHVGWITVGAEAMIFVPKNGYESAQFLFEDMGMVAAEEYDFVCADGWSETIHKDDLGEVEIFINEETGMVDATSVANPDYTLMNIKYIIPTGLEQGAEAPAEGIAKINVFANGIADLTAVDSYYGGSTPEAFSVKELLEVVGMTSGSSVTITSYLDDDPETIDFENFAQRYITLDNSKERQPYTLGKVQPKSEYVKNAGYFVIDNTNAILYVPETYVEGAGMALTDVLAFLGMENAASVDLVCADGYTENVPAEKFAEVTLMHISGRLDASSPANPGYTLYNTMYIIPKG